MKVNDSSYVYPAQAVYLPPDSELFRQLSKDIRYVAEPKKNGWRCMVRVKPSGVIELWTRRNTIIADPLPNLRAQLVSLKLKPDSILDGELMEHRGQIKEQLVLWGMIKWGSKWLSALPYRDVNDMVRGVVSESANIKMAIQTIKDKEGFYAKVMLGEYGPGNEGIVIKSMDAPVPFGWKGEATHRLWFKVKPVVLADGVYQK